MATIRDVAVLAGVSVSTVSIILNGNARERHIPEATRQRVEEAMRSLSYRPSRTARALRGKRRPLIALLWVLDERSTFFMRVVRGLSAVAADPQRPFDFVILPYRNGKLAEMLPDLRDEGITGVLIGALSPQDQALLESAGLSKPVCLLNRSAESCLCCRTDIGEIGRLAAAFFMDRGCRAVGFVSDRVVLEPKAARRQAVLQACLGAGILCPEAAQLKTENSLSGGLAAAEQMLSLPRRPDGVYLDNEIIAAGFSAACHARGIEEFPLLAIGLSHPELGRHLHPSISLIDVPGEAIGEQGGRMIAAAVYGEQPPRETICPCRLIRP